MAFLVGGANSAADTGPYDIDNSLRFNDDDSAYLSITPGSAGNRRTYTISTWVKRGNISATQGIFSAEQTKDDTTALVFGTADSLLFTDRPSDNRNINLLTNRLFRDPSAWYHLVIAVDTTQGTDTNRVKIYVNGVQETSFSTSSYPSQNYDTAYWNNTNEHRIGMFQDNSALHYDGYISEFNLIDGQALHAGHFGEPDKDNPDIWIPKKYEGTYGTNGFLMEFKQSSVGSGSTTTIGADTSGNLNHLDSTNVATTDQATDTPTNNFATMNPLMSGATLAEGNLQVSGTFTSKSSIAMQNGKWYIELKCTNDNDYNPQSGIGQVGYDAVDNPAATDYPGNFTDSYSYRRDGYVYANGSNTQTGGTVVAQNEIVGFAIDLDSGTKTIKYYVEGSLTKTENLSETKSNPYVFMTYASGSQAGEGQVNFGNPVHSISSGNADANGYGNFEFAVPSGYFALCTKNLAQYG